MQEIKYDEKLWFELKNSNCKGRHYILGNPHTFNGRIMGYCTNKKVSFCFSITEISNMSLESEYWIKGFLSGNEPEPPVDEEGDTLFEGREYNHWCKSIELFHKTGNWYVGERNCEECGKLLLNSIVGFKCQSCNKNA
ncbi:hypothetical protein [Vallitalea guaymasensis]|uniref:hypothetical protein n=1 Tax=Vallitalea guaymasensis TaxID=1185412 RepID=UPI002354FF35|nr:hypothetical protein [Vallitalea guaymasensis]